MVAITLRMIWVTSIQILHLEGSAFKGGENCAAACCAAVKSQETMRNGHVLKNVVAANIALFIGEGTMKNA